MNVNTTREMLDTGRALGQVLIKEFSEINLSDTDMYLFTHLRCILNELMYMNDAAEPVWEELRTDYKESSGGFTVDVGAKRAED